MPTPKCQFCAAPTPSPRAKICGSKPCKSKRSLEHQKRRAPVTKPCAACKVEFQTVDRRNRFCSPRCKYAGAAKTMLGKYGVSNPNQLPKVPERRALECARKSAAALAMWRRPDHGAKRAASNLKKYGVVCTFSLPKSVSARHAAIQTGYGTRSARVVPILNRLGCQDYGDFCDRIIRRIEEAQVAPYSREAKVLLRNEFGVSPEVIGDALTYRNREDLLYAFKSSGEQDLYGFLRATYSGEILRNRRPAFMDGQELDFYLPDAKFAVEYHGLAFHSARPIHAPKPPLKVKRAHLRKYELCKAAGIRLFQVFEDEWRDRTEIVQSMLRARLGCSPRRIFARNCEIKALDPAQARAFFTATHIAGAAQGPHAFGLFAGTELVAALSLRGTWHQAHGPATLEIARFASALDTTVVGGFQKLLSAVMRQCRNWGVKALLTYADCRFGTGGVYQAAGFTHLGHTGPNYYYERNGVRETRFTHRRRSDAPGSEWEQNAILGWFPIYDAGSERYLLRIA